MTRFLLLLTALIATPAIAAERHLAAVLRQVAPGTGWYLIDTPGHTPAGVSHATTEVDGTLRVHYAAIASEVGSVSITVDETYAPTDLRVGASVGLAYTELQFFAPFEAQLAGLTPTWGSYITTTGDRFKIDTSTALIDGRVKVTHPTMQHASALGPTLTLTQIGAATPSVFVQSQSRTGFVLEAPPSFWVTGKQVLIRRGMVRVRAQDVSSKTGNLWYLGVADMP